MFVHSLFSALKEKCSNISVWINLSCIVLCCRLQRNPAGNPAAASSARGGVPASARQSPAEPHPAGRAAATQVVF